MVEQLIQEMILYYTNDPKRIQHFIKVHDFALTIGRLEHLQEKELTCLEVAAVVHDIGIKRCEEKYGSCSGKLQEIEGPEIARELLARLGYEDKLIERVCFLIAHHHTYDSIEGLDYQILVEADFLVNLQEDQVSKEGIRTACDRIFVTKTGILFCKTMFGIK